MNRIFQLIIFLFFAISTPMIYSDIETFSNPYQGGQYKGTVEVSFELDSQDHLHVKILTERLLIRSVEPQDIEHYVALFGDAEVMQKYATGQVKTREEVEKRVNQTWLRRWQQGDPFSALAIFKWDPSKGPVESEFIGHIVLGYSEEPGTSELAFLLKKEYWQQGYGIESATAVVHHYGKKLADSHAYLGGVPFQKIEATVREDNEASIKILEYIGMKRVNSVEKYGTQRYLYVLNTEDLGSNEGR